MLDVKEFSSVDELYFYMEEMFSEGLNETLISKALDIFIRDIEKFTGADLETDQFKNFIRELSKNVVTFSKPSSYVKTAKFCDLFVVNDPFIWINLE